MSQMLSAPLPWLSILVALPALGAVLLLAIPSLRRAGRAFALILSLCELVVALVRLVAFLHLPAFRGLFLDSPDWPELGAGRECPWPGDDPSGRRLGSPGGRGRME